MIISNSGPKIQAEDIAAFEADFKVALPPTYREFLLRFNGGAPTPDTIRVIGAPESPTDVQIFFGLNRKVESSNLTWNLSLAFRFHPNHRLLPIACDSGGNLFCLRFREEFDAEVVYCEMQSEDFLAYHVASSFEEFTAGLRPFDD